MGAEEEKAPWRLKPIRLLIAEGCLIDTTVCQIKNLICQEKKRIPAYL